ncbi:MAG: two-component system, response regulator PdtaR [Gaiellaceae bacterium]|nr:two-component system, response regulator PdtaR [Gaiellaceae bacterium]
MDDATTARRVVIGEDETLVRLDLVALLERAGFHVVGTAAEGHEFVRLALELLPDLIVSDIRMPGVDGIEATRQILAVHDVPVVFVTGFPQADIIARSVEAGAFAYLTKPFREADLMAAIAHAEARFSEGARLRAEADALHASLDRRRLVERAAVVVARAERISPADALERISQASVRSGRTTAAVAEAILEAVPDV